MKTKICMLPINKMALKRIKKAAFKVAVILILSGLLSLIDLPLITKKRPGLARTAGRAVYYDPTIKDIITNDCGRCHSGPSRNLMDYDNLKAYAESGMLAAMVQGSMSRFAGGDQGTILEWINAGTPEKPAANQGNVQNNGNTNNNTSKNGVNTAINANFFNGLHHLGGGKGGGGGATQPYVPDVPVNGITYENTIQYVLAKDCLRCHSGHFRNLTTYDNVSIYVKNGLLKTLVQRGGAMHRFALRDSRWIVAWIENGAPRK
ncbi:Putative redox protein with 2 CXXCH motives (heme binding). Named HMP1 on GenBank. Homology with genes DMR_41150 and DMR_41250 of RS-1 [Desulfamplus magnetovallimortis]|nr:Putative redox protein with 2 CXXCH motives (heme binding). Named HMP1 on GenBank. Homology with genes DMR_41150 and DMR_41250 of RS-1 [Desulfamplus magnetovallimortis BW-1]SLM32721.1 Putative redox protein with 2 CXXCH motives (heme binding). Named HMP1 on GenBank. Homology with genes DMR_41150 and DMR_41250 of RS-1 [Desulfamplus magnetovallimortis]